MRFTSSSIGRNAAPKRPDVLGSWPGVRRMAPPPRHTGAMRLPCPPHLRRWLVLPVTLLGLCAAGCGGSDDEGAPVSLQSAERETTTTSDGPPPGSSEEFCAEVERLDSDPALDADADPAAAIEALQGLADLAPEELSADFALLAGVAEDLAAVDPEDPESIDEVFDIVLRPDVIEASTNINDYTKQECGIDLEADDEPVDEPDTTVADDATGDIDLEDIDAVEEANASATWPAKITSTSILNDTDVELIASDDALLTADEGLAACVAVRDALVVINPQVTVTVTSGGTRVAAAPAGGACAPA